MDDGRPENYRPRTCPALGIRSGALARHPLTGFVLEGNTSVGWASRSSFRNAKLTDTNIPESDLTEMDIEFELMTNVDISWVSHGKQDFILMDLEDARLNEQKRKKVSGS